MSDTNTPGKHPENPDEGEEWKGDGKPDDQPGPNEPEGYEKEESLENILTTGGAIYNLHKDHLVELHRPVIRALTELVHAIRGNLHEDCHSEVTRMEAACAWSSGIAMLAALLKEEIDPRLGRVYQKMGNDDMPLILDRTISAGARGSYMTKACKELCVELKKEVGIDLIGDQGKLLGK